MTGVQTCALPILSNCYQFSLVAYLLTGNGRTLAANLERFCHLVDVDSNNLGCFHQLLGLDVAHWPLPCHQNIRLRVFDTAFCPVGGQFVVGRGADIALNLGLGLRGCGDAVGESKKLSFVGRICN